MRHDKLTVKAQESLAAARDAAIARHHAEIMPEHLLLALLEQEAGVGARLLTRIGADPRAVLAALDTSFEGFSTIHGAGIDVDASRALKNIWEAAATEAGNMKDEFVSTEHFMLALAASTERGNGARAILKTFGVDKQRLLEALVAVRGNQRVTDNDPEAKYEALERYTRDLTALARSGKLDPVIGRDEEIRRTIQILSRRSKNNPVLVGEAGVGKTAVVEGIAQRVALGDVQNLCAIAGSSRSISAL